MPEIRTTVQNVRQRLNGVERADTHLYSILALVLSVIAAGFAAIISPNLRIQAFDDHYLAPLLFGFIGLVLLFNAYVFDQRRKLKSTRQELLNEVFRGEIAERNALLDPLTEVFNRRYLDIALPKEISRADRRETPIAIAVIDVDDFKSVNTRFGHPTGDTVLTEIARLLNSTFRGSDTIVRYGGDEFLVIMPDTDDAAAKFAVERMYKRVTEWNVAACVPGYHMSLSVGVADYHKGDNIQDVIQRADRRMYNCKQGKPSKSAAIGK